MPQSQDPNVRTPAPSWKRRLLATAVLVGLLLFNLATEDHHPVRQTLIGLVVGGLLVSVEHMRERREALGKPPLAAPSLSEQWSLCLTIAFALLAAVAISAFAIGAIVHG